MSSELEIGLRSIQTEQIDYLIAYLDTGVFNNKNNSAYMKAYSLVYTLADKDDCSDKVYDYYIDTIKYYTKGVYDNELNRLQGPQLLDSLIRRWENHKIFVYWMRKIFTYLDRYHVKNKNVPPLFQAGLNIFKAEIMDKVKDKVRTAIIEQANRERNREIIERNRIKEPVICFAQMGLTDAEIVKLTFDHVERLAWKGRENLEYYKENFEKAFIEEAKVYYDNKSAGWLAAYSCPEYLQEAKRALEEEEERADKCLDQSSKNTLINVVVGSIVVAHAQTLAEMENTGCIEMLKHDKRDELKLMFNVFRRSEPTLSHITSKMTPYIESKGTLIVTDQEKQQDPLKYTEALLMFKHEIDTLVEYSFESHSQFQRFRDLAFQNFMNKCKFSAPYIASYCDNEMRKGLKGVSEIDTEHKLEAIIRLFVCLHDRDVFIRNYTRYLAKRLLDGSSVSDEAEQSMIAKLKVECGHNIVNKISNMYQDIALSKTLMDEFRALSHRGNPNSISMYVNMLRSGCWPDSNSEPCMIPDELQTCTKAFEAFYLNKHQGRNVTWLLGYGNCELGTKFASRNYTLTVNPYQTTILLLFNQHDVLTVNQIKEATRLSDKTLKAQLIMFFNPKMKLLNKTSRGKVIEDDEPISVNSAFASQSVRVNYIPKKVKKIDVDTKEDDQAITAERKNILDAVIVRIMKGRRRCGHQELLQEVMRQVNHFRPQPPMIKAQIESLIQREFLARDEADRSVYNYIP